MEIWTIPCFRSATSESLALWSWDLNRPNALGLRRLLRLRPRLHQLLGHLVIAAGLHLVVVGMMDHLAGKSAVAPNVIAVGLHPVADGMMVQLATISVAVMRWA